MLRKIIVLLTLLWMIAGGYYFYSQVDWKSGAVLATGIIGFLTAIANAINKKDSKASLSQKAKASKNSVIVQTGRDYISKGDARTDND